MAASMRTDDLVGAVWLPGDGKANPTDITQALAKGARNGGARIFERDARHRHRRQRRPRHGRRHRREAPIACEIVVHLRRPMGAQGRRRCAA